MVYITNNFVLLSDNKLGYCIPQCFPKFYSQRPLKRNVSVNPK